LSKRYNFLYIPFINPEIRSLPNDSVQDNTVLAVNLNMETMLKLHNLKC
jgi:hypothetical protein